jgi:hypothetical protein
MADAMGQEVVIAAPLKHACQEIPGNLVLRHASELYVKMLVT